ncbi:MAG TPA: hypothetical protein VFM69_04575 [Pricia sp.]|nr:hypothetical protein [Pricia sp.]
MKKMLLILSMACSMVAMASCTTDDSNDIEILKPGDTTIVGRSSVTMPLPCQQGIP